MASKEQDQSTFQELKADIRGKTLRRLYIFHGEEVFLLQHYLEQMKSLFANGQGGYKNVLYPDLEIASDICTERIRRFEDTETEIQDEASLEEEFEEFTCPECGNKAVIPSGGCNICLQCGYSKCN